MPFQPLPQHTLDLVVLSIGAMLTPPTLPALLSKHHPPSLLCGHHILTELLCNALPALMDGSL